MKVEVDKNYDYMKLIWPWPVNSFHTGVVARPRPPKLVVNILNVDKDILIDRVEKIKEMKDIYGLINIERITTRENEPNNKLRANVRSISDFIKCKKQGIYSSLTSRKHKVTPSIIHSKKLEIERTRVIELENKMNKYITDSDKYFVNLDNTVSILGDHVSNLDAKVTDIDSKIKKMVK
ncbi:unnamed protein product [Brachionus calyciflorus]|uniref:Uncharacterized protein n=1 Tax=Brachionus calyciflorus TaxID=104777 RepID=A0A813YAV6_9BILA|nr:unnamed protein product [Brachionus calyciflorus]